MTRKKLRKIYRNKLDFICIWCAISGYISFVLIEHTISIGNMYLLLMSVLILIPILFATGFCIYLVLFERKYKSILKELELSQSI